jgi:hypothetical protein
VNIQQQQVERIPDNTQKNRGDKNLYHKTTSFKTPGKPLPKQVYRAKSPPRQQFRSVIIEKSVTSEEATSSNKVQIDMGKTVIVIPTTLKDVPVIGS